MAEIVDAIDVSNYQPADLTDLVATHGPEHVIVRMALSVERDGLREHAQAQIASVLDLGKTLGGYFWAYGDESPEVSVEEAWAYAVVPVLWCDLEAAFNVPGPDWLRRARRRGRTIGAIVGWYTRLSWIRDFFPGGFEAFREFAMDPLWLADYDGVASLDSTLPPGAARQAGKQYTDTPIDLDVFDADYTIVGRVPMPPSADVGELNQFNPANYDTRAEYAAIDGAACSAASLAAVLNHYGVPANISEGLRRIRATGDDVTPQLGLLNLLGQGESIADALDDAGIPSSTHPWAELTRAQFREVVGSGRPIIAQMHNYLGRGLGHFLVVDGMLADGSGVLVADSNAGQGKRFSYDWPTFWSEMAGGVAIFPDEAPVPEPAPGGTNEEGEDMARIAELEAQVADLQAKVGSQSVAIAYLADTVADRVVSLVSKPLTVASLKEAAAISDEAQRVRVQFVGPRP